MLEVHRNAPRAYPEDVADDVPVDETPPRREPRFLYLFWHCPVAMLVLLTLGAVSVPMGYFLPIMMRMFAWTVFGAATLL